MAIRPVFISTESAPFYRKQDTDFVYYSGFALVQKQKSIKSLHENFCMNNSKKNIIEISTKSNTELGKSLSAFNLVISGKKSHFSVESAFQGSKVFELGGPYSDLINKESLEAKRDPRLKTSGKIVKFNYFGRIFPTEPLDYFYNWLYINALNVNEDLAKQIIEYDAFTDIEFNPNKSINCQARACAIYVGLVKSNKLKEALLSEKDFFKIIYPDFRSYSQVEF